MSLAVTTWYLEQTAPSDLNASAEPDPAAGIRIARTEVPSPEFSRFLYASVGADCSWTDRLSWTDERWQRYLERPGVETWVAYAHGTLAGYLELEARDEGVVEVAYLGLLPALRGRRIGGHLLSYGVARAWDLGGRWAGREATRRVTVNTCSLDGPHALPNYEKRGFRIYDTKTETKTETKAESGHP